MTRGRPRHVKQCLDDIESNKKWKASKWDMYVPNTPFSKKIPKALVLCEFYLPTLEIYNETMDLEDHIGSFAGYDTAWLQRRNLLRNFSSHPAEGSTRSISLEYGWINSISQQAILFQWQFDIVNRVKYSIPTYGSPTTRGGVLEEVREKIP